MPTSACISVSASSTNLNKSNKLYLNCYSQLISQLNKPANVMLEMSESNAVCCNIYCYFYSQPWRPMYYQLLLVYSNAYYAYNTAHLTIANRLCYYFVLPQYVIYCDSTLPVDLKAPIGERHRRGTGVVHK